MDSKAPHPKPEYNPRNHYDDKSTPQDYNSGECCQLASLNIGSEHWITRDIFIGDTKPEPDTPGISTDSRRGAMVL